MRSRKNRGSTFAQVDHDCSLYQAVSTYNNRAPRGLYKILYIVDTADLSVWLYRPMWCSQELTSLEVVEEYSNLLTIVTVSWQF